MHKTAKRSAAAAAAGVLALTLALTGCGSSNNTSNTGTKDTATGGNASPAAAGDDTAPVTFSVFMNGPGQQPTPDNKILKLIKDETGITFNQEFLVGDLQQKLGVMIAGGDYPDILSGDDKLINAKAYIPLEDLIEKYAPNLKKHYGAVWNQIKDESDGHIYVLPSYGVYQGKITEPTYQGPGFWLQKGVLEEMGYPTPKTLDEYFDIIAKYKEKHPDMIGFESLNFDWRVFPLQNPPEHLSGHPNDGAVIVDNNVAQIFADKDISKTYYKKLNDINAQGLMDKEAFVQNYDQYLAKVASGKVIGMFDQHWNFQDGEKSLISQGKLENTYIGFPLLYPGAEEWYRDRGAVGTNRGFGISINAKDPVRIIKFWDKMITEDWQKTLQWGVKGEDYEVNADGSFYRTPEQRANADQTSWQVANKISGMFGYMPKIQGTYSDGNAADAGTQPQEFFDSLKPYDQKILKAYNKKSWSEFFKEPKENNIYFPAYSIVLKDGSPAQLAQSKLNDLMIKYLPKAIMASPAEFDGVWQDYVDRIHKLDIKAYEDRMNEGIQQRIEKWSVK
ncbi:sugar ABC transporter periplasmic protein [Paenibacillus sp. FSL R7-277]|uniref:Aldouronate transport system substrate-binding protein n=1 Tax=Paenibacillus silagei TaxID=1670801 RepID=A0ABS4P2A4_9BACL|nr:MULTISPECIES: extracellular solute-binding protein [Paenibacillus]ETT73228.1 sugar ABC transporter periplasmic protein [Paenibacillus sp. FSL R7-277]MBP2116431.1 putative aldouronate transport system substrate-binding protein [Paenibacillus silagei]